MTPDELDTLEALANTRLPWPEPGQREIDDQVRAAVPALVAALRQAWAREAELLRWRDEWEVCKASVEAGRASAFRRGAEAMRFTATALCITLGLRPVEETRVFEWLSAISVPEETP